MHTGVFGAVIGTLGVDDVLGRRAWLVVLVVSLLTGLQAGVEAAAHELGGIEALGSGSSRVALVRQVALGASVAVSLALATYILRLATIAKRTPTVGPLVLRGG